MDADPHVIDGVRGSRLPGSEDADENADQRSLWQGEPASLVAAIAHASGQLLKENGL
jgi:hypothetical protein